MPCSCRATAFPLPCRVAKGLDCVFFYLIYTVRPCLIHTCYAQAHAEPLPCSDHAVLKATSQGHGTARHGHGMTLAR
jgi:hypothetical protein